MAALEVQGVARGGRDCAPMAESRMLAFEAESQCWGMRDRNVRPDGGQGGSASQSTRHAS